MKCSFCKKETDINPGFWISEQTDKAVWCQKCYDKVINETTDFLNVILGSNDIPRLSQEEINDLGGRE